MTEPTEASEDFASELLGVLRDDASEAPPDLPARAIRRAHASLTARDLLDLTTAVFLMRFFVPLLDLVAAIMGADAPERKGGRRR